MMGGALYVLAEILLFLVLAAAIGFVIGRATVGRGDRSGPLKRLAEVETTPVRSTETAGQAADLRRRLGVAYQTIRELEESNMHLREAAEQAEESEDENAAPDEESEVAASEPPTDTGANEVTETTEAEASDDADQPVATPATPKKGGPADLIQAAKAAKQGEAPKPASDPVEAAGDVSEADATEA